MPKTEETGRKSSKKTEREIENRTLAVKDWPVETRPIERLHRLGPRNLTDPELVAILLGTGNRISSAHDLAQEICMGTGSQRYDAAFLKSRSGIGKTKSARILAGLELGRRWMKPKPNEIKLRIRSSREAFEYLKPYYSGLENESFFLIFMNVKNEPLHVEEIARGSDSGVFVEPRWIFTKALRANAHAILVAHNHPSGEPKPSTEDDRLTEKIQNGCKLLGLRFLDHLILTEDQFFSYAEQSFG